MDISSFNGPSKDPVTPIQTDDRNVHAVQHIGDRRESETPDAPVPGSSVSIEIRDHPLQLVLRVVRDKLNEAFPHDIKLENFQGLSEMELTPATTSRSIVAHATSLYEPFKLIQQNLAEKEMLEAFMDTLIKTIELGFDEAQEILQNLGVLHGETERDLDYTFTLTQRLLIDFRDSMST